MTEAACPGCGLSGPVEDGPLHAYMASSPYCWRLYGELLAREYGNPLYMAVHQLTVDAYAVQHPGVDERRANQSVQLHLASLHLQLEEGASGETVRAVMKSLASKGDFGRLDPPPRRTDWLRVDDVLGATTADEHRSLVTDWARSAWEAWSAHHEPIRRLANSA